MEGVSFPLIKMWRFADMVCMISAGKGNSCYSSDVEKFNLPVSIFFSGNSIVIKCGSVGIKNTLLCLDLTVLFDIEL